MFGINYNKPGKGVNKRDPNQPRTSIFFELLWRKLWSLCKVNLFYLITSLPTFVVLFFVLGLFSAQITDKVATLNIFKTNELLMFDVVLRFVFSFLFLIFIGQGPTTAGFTYTLRNYAREEHVFFFSDWWDQAKDNFRQSIIIWIVDVMTVFLFVTAITFYWNNGLSFFAYLICVLALIYFLIHFYIYQLIITFENSIWNTLKNALILALEKGPRNLLMLLITTVIHIGVPYMSIKFGWSVVFWIIFILAELLILPTLTSFMINFFIYPQLEIYIKAEK